MEYRYIYLEPNKVDDAKEENDNAKEENEKDNTNEEEEGTWVENAIEDVVDEILGEDKDDEKSLTDEMEKDKKDNNPVFAEKLDADEEVVAIETEAEEK